MNNKLLRLIIIIAAISVSVTACRGKIADLHSSSADSDSYIESAMSAISYDGVKSDISNESPAFMPPAAEQAITSSNPFYDASRPVSGIIVPSLQITSSAGIYSPICSLQSMTNQVTSVHNSLPEKTSSDYSLYSPSWYSSFQNSYSSKNLNIVNLYPPQPDLSKIISQPLDQFYIDTFQRPIYEAYHKDTFFSDEVYYCFLGGPYGPISKIEIITQFLNSLQTDKWIFINGEWDINNSYDKPIWAAILNNKDNGTRIHLCGDSSGYGYIAIIDKGNVYRYKVPVDIYKKIQIYQICYDYENNNFFAD